MDVLAAAFQKTSEEFTQREKAITDKTEALQKREEEFEALKEKTLAEIEQTRKKKTEECELHQKQSLEEIENERTKLKKEWEWVKATNGVKERVPTQTTEKDPYPEIIELNVGGQRFTTKLATLRKYEGSSMLEAMFTRHTALQDSKGRYFIDRDGATFKYVLEFLTYDKITSFVEPHIRDKLLLDFDYYGIKVKEEDIPGAKMVLAQEKEEEKKEEKEEEEGIAWLNVRCSRAHSNGQDIVWDQHNQVPAKYFTVANSTITVREEGWYQISVRYTCQCSTHGQGSANIDLYLSGTVVARVYHGQNDGYQQTRSLTETLFIPQGSNLHVRYFSNSNLLADAVGNSLTVVKLPSSKPWGGPLLHLRCTAACGNGSFMNWNKPLMVPPGHFVHNGGNTVTILKPGLYQISVRYTCQCSTHGNNTGNVNLNISGTTIARAYHGQNDGYYQSRQIQEIVQLKAQDTIQVQYYSNSNTYADEFGNSLQILFLQ